MEALASVQEGSPAWHSGLGTSLLGHTYALMGRKPEAQTVVQELAQMSKTQYVSPAYMAAIYAALGDKEHALEWLQKACEARAPSVVMLKVNPRYDLLRSDPRFTALLKTVHLVN